MWMLGSSGGSAEPAGQVGMNIALARFISPDHCTPDILILMIVVGMPQDILEHLHEC